MTSALPKALPATKAVRDINFAEAISQDFTDTKQLAAEMDRQSSGYRLFPVHYGLRHVRERDPQLAGTGCERAVCRGWSWPNPRPNGKSA